MPLPLRDPPWAERPQPPQAEAPLSLAPTPLSAAGLYRRQSPTPESGALRAAWPPRVLRSAPKYSAVPDWEQLLEPAERCSVEYSSASPPAVAPGSEQPRL